MQLYYAEASPFARKVRILAQEVGLDDRIELIALNPWTDETLRAVNPLCKVPTLINDEGQAIYDSRVICIYLDRLAGTHRVVGAPTNALVMEALADGIGDAGVRRVREERRRGGDGHDDVIERQNQAIQAALDEAEQTLDAAGFEIGEIALLCAIAYLNFRLPGDNWLEGRPKLAAWYEALRSRPSVAATEPA